MTAVVGAVRRLCRRSARPAAAAVVCALLPLAGCSVAGDNTEETTTVGPESQAAAEVSVDTGAPSGLIAPPPQHTPTRDRDGKRCPGTVVVAARGSEQNSAKDVVPTSYAEGAQPSDGWEGPNLRAFLSFVAARNPGALADTQVLGLPPRYYPASLPLPQLAEDDEQLDAVATLNRLAGLLGMHPPVQIATEASSGLERSLTTAATGIPQAVADYEEATGCAPQYVLLGYSQGAVALALAEADIDEATGGRVGAVAAMGAPRSAAAGLPEIVGLPLSGMSPVQVTQNRLQYCRAGDAVCDPTVENAAAALASGGGEHTRYFLDAAADPGAAQKAEAAVADQFAGWLEGGLK